MVTKMQWKSHKNFQHSPLQMIFLEAVSRIHDILVTFWCESGSADPCLWLTDPDPAIFITDLQDDNKKQIFFKVRLHITFWRYIYIIFQRQKEALLLNDKKDVDPDPRNHASD